MKYQSKFTKERQTFEALTGSLYECKEKMKRELQTFDKAFEELREELKPS